MLGTVFQSASFPYDPNDNYLSNLLGITVAADGYGNNTLRLFGATNVKDSITHEGVSYWAFDPNTGAYELEKRFQPGVFFNASFTQSRLGLNYFNFPLSINESQLVPYDLNTFQADGPSIPASRFIPGANPSFGIVALDESQDVLMNAPSPAQYVDGYHLSTGVHKFQIWLPSQPVAICLANVNFAYVLCNNGMLVLVNYFTQKVEGVVKMPPSLLSGGAWSGGNNMALYWYGVNAQLMVSEQLPDVGGHPTTAIRGFRMKPYATRLTTPIPTRSPQTGKTVPVFFKLVDDSNLGRGGGIISVTATGPQTLQNTAAVDAVGNSFIQVGCTGPGTVAINCSITVPDPSGG